MTTTENSSRGDRGPDPSRLSHLSGSLGATHAPGAPLTEESDPFCLSPTSAAGLLAGAPWERFAVIGDSLSAGTGDPSPGYGASGWAGRVEGVLRRVRPATAYLNTAEIGATTADTLARQADRMIAFRPDLVHVPSGANDLICPAPDFTGIERELRRLFELAAGTGARVTVFTLGRAFVVRKYPDWPDRVRRVNALTRRLAADHDAVLVDMWDHPVNSRPDLLSADRIHFASSGQAVMAAEYVRALAGVLDARQGGARPGVLGARQGGAGVGVLDARQPCDRNANGGDRA
ncbi:SGNH/GDSL hydrolase family protein [Streptomyces diastatochromogenes]|uniref:SGNH/GDSL hydrolase family protein n=1 Tax=Streptomyces diastatochromogenes TaxID=42236 RepID=UPI000B915E66|nr:SGNH/GDSL hydrolase family protein [Streptomyces diastatochromogenes]